MILRALVVAFAASVLFAAPASAGAVYNATSCSSTHVQDQLTLVAAAADSPSDPPTVNIPAGNCTWATQVSLTSRSVILRGAGDSTVICDNYSTDILRISPAISNRVRLSSIKFTDCGGDPNQPLIRIVGPSGSSPPQVRLDHLTFTSVNRGYKIYVLDVIGVADHITCDETGIFHQCFSVQHPQWAGSDQAHGSWSAATNLGSADAFYVEDSTYILGGTGSFLADGEAGGRIVNRMNRLTDSQMGIHGTDTTNLDTRGPRYQEVYGNILTYTGGWGSSVSFRGGTGVAFNNTATYASGSSGPFVSLVTNRTRTSNFDSWGGCDGLGPYDDNDGTLYASGTVSSWNAGTLVLTVNGSPGWTTDQWASSSTKVYSAINKTQQWTKSSGRQFYKSAAITSNTAGTLTLQDGAGFGDVTFTASDSWEIRSARTCLDQAGRGRSDVVTPGNPPTPQSWVHNALEPIYAWNNIGSSWTYGEVNSLIPLATERDYYATVSSFNPNAISPTCTTNAPIGNGSCGVGVGLRSAIQTTGAAEHCTTGVGFWVTNEGSWNTLLPANTSGRFYKCTATNTWTLFYTPYTYPHPLRTSGVLSVEPPTPVKLGHGVHLGGGVKLTQ